jgi:hypothetical protein
MSIIKNQRCFMMQVAVTLYLKQGVRISTGGWAW